MEQVKTQEVTTVSKSGPTVVTTEHPQKTYEKKKFIFKTYQIVWYILGLVEIMLGFRIALLALGANPNSGFASTIYMLTNPLALPFRGIFNTASAGESIFEWSTIVAALVYALVAYGIVYLIQLVKPVTPTEVNKTIDNT